MSKKRILVRLGRPPMSTNQPASETLGAGKPANAITELEEEGEDASVPLRPPEPEPVDIPPPCDISEVSTLDDIMCRPPKKRKPEAEAKPTQKHTFVECVDLTKGVTVMRRPAFAGKNTKRQVSLAAWLK